MLEALLRKELNSVLLGIVAKELNPSDDMMSITTIHEKGAAFNNYFWIMFAFV